jgi:hypothetical protein
MERIPAEIAKDNAHSKSEECSQSGIGCRSAIRACNRIGNDEKVPGSLDICRLDGPRHAEGRALAQMAGL